MASWVCPPDSFWLKAVATALYQVVILSEAKDPFHFLTPPRPQTVKGDGLRQPVRASSSHAGQADRLERDIFIGQRLKLLCRWLLGRGLSAEHLDKTFTLGHELVIRHDC